MPTPSTIVLFASAALVLLLIPGPAVLYIIARGIQQGRPASLVSAMSVGVGNMGHATAATLGLSALLASSTLAFSVVKYVGAAYLLYLGIQTLLKRDESGQAATWAPSPLSRIFHQGVLVSLFNPKTAIFFLAFLPQFVDPARGPVAGQVFLLGCLFVAMGLCTDSLYALLAGTLGGWLRESARFLRLRRYVTGTVYIGLGVTAALASPHRK
jgi:threonine/homoserine/homoserine lactone efflux protein